MGGIVREATKRNVYETDKKLGLACTHADMRGGGTHAGIDGAVHIRFHDIAGCELPNPPVFVARALFNTSKNISIRDEWHTFTMTSHRKVAER